LIVCLNYLDYNNSPPPAASAPSVEIYRQRKAVVACINPSLAVGNPLVPCGGGGMHHRPPNKWVFALQTLAPTENFTSACSEGCPLTIRCHSAGTETMNGVHMAPFPPALAMVGHGRRGVPLGVYFVSPVRELIIYLKCTVILLYRFAPFYLAFACSYLPARPLMCPLEP